VILKAVVCAEGIVRWRPC